MPGSYTHVAPMELGRMPVADGYTHAAPKELGICVYERGFLPRFHSYGVAESELVRSWG